MMLPFCGIQVFISDGVLNMQNAEHKIKYSTFYDCAEQYCG